MFVTGIVFFALFVVTTFAMIAFVLIVALRAMFEKGARILDRHLWKIRTEQYVQLVALPLVAAIVGGVISTAIPIFVDYPPWKHSSKINVGYILITIALVIGIIGPLAISELHANPENLILVERINRLKDGDWERDNKDKVIRTIDEAQAAIDKKLTKKDRWFLVLLAIVVASDIGWIILDHAVDKVWPNGFEILVMAGVILFGVIAAFWIRPKSLRSAKADLKFYRDKADKLSQPQKAVTPLLERAEPSRYKRQDVWIAVGGLVVGAILTRFGATNNRKPGN